MSSTDQYEIQFIWPSTSPQTVIVTGTFDNWTASIRLNKTSTGFEVKTRLPWGEKVKYKFIVDGEWRLRDDRPTEVDYGGYVNNVLTTPPKPAAVEPSVANKSQTRVLNGNGHAADAVSKPELDAPVVNGTAKVLNGDVKAHNVQAANGTGFLSDLASTIAARDGTSSAIGYVASGLGAAMHSVVGVDPINIQKITISTPKADEMFTLPDGQEPVSNSTDFEPEYPVLETSFHSPTSPVAPIVPIMIVPVNASENNTIPRETFNPEIDSQVQIPVISAKAPPPSDTTPAPIAVSEAEPILGVTDNSVEAETPSKEQPASEAPAVSNGSDVLEAIVPVSTVVDNTSAPSPASVAEVETIEGAVLVKAGQSEELASAIPRVANEASSQEAEQKVDAPISVEATPAVTEASETATPEGAPATKETPAPSTSEPVKVEETKEGSVAAEPVSTTTAVPETKIPPPNVLPITSVQQPSAPEPTTPTKSKFPSVSQQSSPSGSPASSKFGSTKRQKRSSILHKLKEIFHHDKEEKVKK